MKIVATTSLPAVDRPNADHWNAALSRQFMFLSAVFASGGENVNFLTQMRTKCVLKYQKSMHCIPYVKFSDLFSSTAWT